ncbi:hypothetical protein R6Z07F_003292 [Ovis aries]
MPARPEVTSAAAPEPPGGRPELDYRASAQPCPRSPEAPSPIRPGGPRRRFPGVSGRSGHRSPRCPRRLSIPGPAAQRGPAYSPPTARRAAASLGSRPRSPNSLPSSEPPERLGGEICGDVADHPGAPCARGSALRLARRAVRAPGASASRCPASSVLGSLEIETSVHVAFKKKGVVCVWRCPNRT